jgi:hypothetical protein
MAQDFGIAQRAEYERPSVPRRPGADLKDANPPRHDLGDQFRGIGELVFLQDRIEGNVFAVMPQFATRDVVGTAPNSFAIPPAGTK